MLCQGSISIRLVSFVLRIRIRFRIRFRFDFFWVRNIFNVATEHVKQIKATRAAIADVHRAERGWRQLELLPLTMGIMITSCAVGFRSEGMGHGANIHACDRSGESWLQAVAESWHEDYAYATWTRRRQLRATFNLKCFSVDGGWRGELIGSNCKHKTETENETKAKAKNPNQKNNTTNKQSLTNIQRTFPHTYSHSLTYSLPSLSHTHTNRHWANILFMCMCTHFSLHLPPPQPPLQSHLTYYLACPALPCPALLITHSSSSSTASIRVRCYYLFQFISQRLALTYCFCFQFVFLEHWVSVFLIASQRAYRHCRGVCAGSRLSFAFTIDLFTRRNKQSTCLARDMKCREVVTIKA